MTKRWFIGTVAASVAFAVTAAIAAQSGGEKGAKGADNQPAPMILLVPVEISDPAMKSGCWAQLYEHRNFEGDMFTIVGPMQIDSADKKAGRQFRRNLESLVTGPKATLTVFERQLFKDKSVKFGPNSKEGGLVKKLGFSGSIQSLTLDCGG